MEKQTSNIKISVVIPSCDRPERLRKTLESVFEQTFEPYEIIVVDNGIKALGQDFFKDNNKIKYSRALPRFGVSQARNMGICLASGDYIAFLDDDDIWDKNYLHEIARVIQKKNPSVILGTIKILETGKVWEHKSQPVVSIEHFKREILRRNPGIIGSNTVLKKDTVFKCSGYNPFLTTGQDKAIVLDLILSGLQNIVRAKSAVILFRTLSEGTRQTDFHKHAQGKKRFLIKYWKHMDTKIRLRNILIYIKLKLNSYLTRK